MISRRTFLKSAGGVTLLALKPLGRGLFAAPALDSPRLPLFTALPYIQPGAGSVLTSDAESMVLAWQTVAGDADFAVDFGLSPAYGRSTRPSRAERVAGRGGDVEARLNWVASLDHLRIGHKYFYRVRGNASVLAEGYFTTRQARGQKIRFVSFGDNSYGDVSDRAIAFHTYRQNPDFVMNCGDNVYDSGTDDEYQRYFFPVYNADVAGERIGAPLLRSVPFYTVVANHDVQGKDPNGHEVANFTLNPDALAFYTAMHLPLNGPEAPAYPTPMMGPPERIAAFRACAGDRYPRMANYSFDYGDVHFLCLDSNRYTDPNDAAMQQWIAGDLGGTDARWKFVIYHHPPYNVGREHHAVQHMRVLSPLFEAHGVDFVLSGHEHNYQRARPLRFAPAGRGRSADIGAADRRVPGTFTVDRLFDGSRRTRADGVLHIVTGAGGKHLYEPEFTDNPSSWIYDDPGSDHVVKMVSNRHSLSLFDVEGPQLTMRQIDETGQELDRIVVTKAPRTT